MKKPTFRRVLAFLVDIIIVSIIASAISSIKFINPDIEKYNETYDKYMEFVENGMQEGNVQQIVNSEEYQNFAYEISYYSKYNSIISIVVTFLYFVVFQFYTKGYTGGKKLLNIKVESTNGELKIYQLLIRSLIINGIVTSTLTVILLFTLNKASYINVQMYVELLNMGLLFVSFGMMLYRKDGRGLHDLLGGTKVVLNK